MDGSGPQRVAVTGRELEVLHLVARHLTNSEIAAELCLSVRTVETHVSSLLRKLQVADRRSLARRADQVGSGEAGGPIRWPVPISSFVGRAEESRDLLAAVATHRMVTVTGPGGVGKTRLALEVAEQFARTRRDAGWFVDLVQVTDPAMVMAAVAAAIGVVEQQGGSVQDAVLSALSGSDALVVLDNCEHLVDATRSCVERLLSRCPSLVVVATSRARLLAPFEWVHPVAGLTVTEDGGDAVTLFLERALAAGAVEPIDRDRVAALCRALDGMALAIELAAARLPSLGLDGLTTALDQRLRFLTTGSGAAERHRSLRDAIAWSTDLLAEQDRELLSAVSVFASWFGVDAAAVVAGQTVRPAEVSDGLARLAEHNLLVVAPGEPTRYRALETVRQFAAERLAELGDDRATAERHRRWCSDRLDALAAGSQDEAWCAEVDRVAPDVRAAVVRATDHGPAAAAASLAEQLAGQLFLRGRPAEAQLRYEQAARLTATDAARVRLLRLAAGAAASRMVGDDTLRLLAESADLELAGGTPAAAAVDLAWMAIYARVYPGILATVPSPVDAERWVERARGCAAGSATAQAAVAAAEAAGCPEDDPRAVEVSERAVRLAREAGDPLLVSLALDTLCAFRRSEGRLAAALVALRDRGDVMAGLPLDASTGFQFNDYLLMASELQLCAGDLPRAGEYADRLAALACYRDQHHLAYARRIKVDALAGDLDRAVACGERFLASWRRAGRPRAMNLNVTAAAMAMVHGLLGDEVGRAEWTELTLTLINDPARLAGCETGWAPTFDAMVALHRDRPDLAVQRLTADVDDRAVWTRWNAALWRPWYAALWAEAAVLGRHPEAADRLRRSRDATAENPVAATIVRRADDLARGDRDAVRAHAGTFTALGCHYQRRRTEALLDV